MRFKNFNNIDQYCDKLFVQNCRELKNQIDLETYQLIDTQALYTVNYKSKAIGLERGTEEFLGYKFLTIHFSKLHELIHPDDRELVCHITMTTIKNACDLGLDFTDRLHLWFRIRHANGDYIRVQRTSGVYEFSSDGKLISTFSFLKKDPSPLADDKVKYKWISNCINPTEFHTSIYGIDSSIFTARELEVLTLLANGYTNPHISSKLSLCTETIRTHKKNMKMKMGVSNSNDLIEYYHNYLKGYIV